MEELALSISTEEHPVSVSGETQSMDSAVRLALISPVEHLFSGVQGQSGGTADGGELVQ